MGRAPAGRLGRPPRRVAVPARRSERSPAGHDGRMTAILCSPAAPASGLWLVDPLPDSWSVAPGRRAGRRAALQVRTPREPPAAVGPAWWSWSLSVGHLGAGSVSVVPARSSLWGRRMAARSSVGRPAGESSRTAPSSNSRKESSTWSDSVGRTSWSPWVGRPAEMSWSSASPSPENRLPGRFRVAGWWSCSRLAGASRRWAGRRTSDEARGLRRPA